MKTRKYKLSATSKGCGTRQLDAPSAPSVGAFDVYFRPALPFVNEQGERHGRTQQLVAEAPWSVAEWAVAPRFDNPRATVLMLVLG